MNELVTKQDLPLDTVQIYLKKLFSGHKTIK